MTNQKIANVPSVNSSEYGMLTPAGKDPSNPALNVGQFVADSQGIALRDKCEYNLTAVKKITSAQILALNATPIELIPAPEVGFSYLIDQVTVSHKGGTPYAGIAFLEDWVLKYSDATGNDCSAAIELTGFLDQATAQIRSVLGSATSPADSSKVVLHQINGEVTGGDFDAQILVQYRKIPTDFVGV